MKKNLYTILIILLLNGCKTNKPQYLYTIQFDEYISVTYWKNKDIIYGIMPLCNGKVLYISPDHDVCVTSLFVNDTIQNYKLTKNK